ncbi:hemagglutinin repeat-containing protein [Xenorhabdus nematophila]|uniref:hemagglutinin repeat-containing protein n=1 Tax=Xenorhabdus nematophila TaxID=628 RepID=UPI0032B702F1
MNKHCYRVIFNKTRQMLMVVSELVSSHTAGQARDRISVPALSSARMALTPLVFGVSLALGLVSLNARADIVADNRAPGTQQPSVIATANGIPQINIQTPSGDGVSRNQYSQFDVAQRGAILNNSGKNTATQLGGLITANPWLAQGEAKIILNEVNSRNPSQLNGFIEVAGQRADVIIANPAGITCQGCGFINARQTTLAAGQTLLENGRLKGFEVGEGVLTVDGKGLNDTGSDYTRLIGRAVTINAKLHANDLTVTTGRNRVDAQGRVTDILSGSEKSQPAFSLDVAAVGGMYANKIKLVGTEQGVGVRNAGQLGAQAGHLTLDSQGKLTNSGAITASADVEIKTAGALENQGRVLAGVDKNGQRTQAGNLTIENRGRLTNQGTLSASDNLTIQNQGDLTNQGRLSAGSLKLNSGGHLTNSGTIDASAQIRLENQGNLINQGDITAAQAIAVNTRDHLDNQGRILAGRHLAIKSASLTSHQNSQRPVGRPQPSVLAAGADKDGKLTQPGNLTLDIKGALDNQGLVTASDNIEIQNQDTLKNAGDITAGQDMTIKTPGALTNQGKVLAGHHLVVHSASFTSGQNGLLSAGTNKTQPGKLTINSRGQWVNQGMMTATADIVIEEPATLTNQGEISADQNIQIKTPGKLTNQGQVLAGHHLDIQSAALESGQKGVLAAGRDKTQPGRLKIRSQGQLDNHGIISASETVHIQNEGAFNHSGDITAGGDITLRARDTLDNTGKMRAGRHLDIHSAGLVSHQDGVLAAGADERGNLTQPGNLIINSRGQLVNQGIMTASADLTLDNQAELTNQGEISADHDIKINTPGKLTNQGKVLAGHYLDIQSAALESGQKGVLAAGRDKTQPGNLKIRSLGQLDNHGMITASDTIDIKNEGAFSHSGDITSGGDITIRARDALDNAGKMRAGRHLDIHSAGLVSHQDGVLAAGTDERGNLTQPGNLIINSRGQLVNQGIMTASEDITLDNQAELKNQGEISSGRDIKLNTPGKLTNQGKVLAGHRLDIHSADVDNQKTGKLAAGIDKTQPGKMKIQSLGQLDNHGTITASESILIENEGAFNHSGDITAGGDITLRARDALDNAGKMRAGRHLDIHSAALVSHQNGVLAAGADAQGKLTRPGNLLIDSRGQLVNQGVMMASDDINIQDQAELKNQGEISSGHDITLNTPGKLTNQGRVLAGHHLNIHSAALENQNKGELAAGTDLHGKPTQPGNLTLDSRGQLINLGIMSAADDIVIDHPAALDNAGEMSTGRDIRLKTAGHLANRGKMLAGRHLNIHSAALSNQENGVLAAGVDNKAGRLSQPGDLTIHSPGELANHGVIRAFGDVTLPDQGNLMNKGDITAGQDLTITTRGHLDNAGRILAGRHLNSQSRSLYSHQGSTLAAGMDKSLRLTQYGHLTVNTTAAARLHGQNLAHDRLSVTARDLSLADSQTAAGDLTLTSDTQIDNTRGRLQAETLTLRSQTLNNHQGKISQTGSQSLTLDHAGGIDNTAGLIESRGQDLTLKAAHITNDNGKLIHAGTGVMAIDTARFQGKAGQLISDGALTLAGGDYQLVKGITSAQHITANVQSLDHRLGKMTQRGTGLMTLAVQHELDNGSGTLSANGTMKVNAGSLNNNTLSENALNNDGENPEKAVLSPSELDNRGGQMVAAEEGQLHLTVTHRLNNQQGQLVASAGLTVVADEMDNQQGLVEASNGAVTLTTGQLTNTDGKIAGQHHLQLTTHALNNERGQIRAGTADINTRQQTLNNTAGLITAERQMTLQTGELLNRYGSIHSGQNLTLDTHGQRLDNRDSGPEGGVFSQGDLRLTVADLHNQAGHIESHGQLDLSGNLILNRQGQLLGGKATRLRGETLNNDQGLLQSGDTLTLNAKSVINRHSGDHHGITSKQAMVLNSGTLDNENGVVASAGHLAITAGHIDNRRGLLAAQTLSLTGQRLDNQSGRITARQGLSVDTQGRTLDNTGGVIDSQTALTVKSGDLTNQRGTLHGQSVTLSANQLDNQQGKILSEAGLRLDAGALLNNRGQILALRALTARVNHQIENNAGLIRSGGKAELSAQEIHNQGTQQPDNGIEGQTVIITADTLHNAQGQLFATENATLNLASRLDNTQGQLQANQQLTVQGSQLAITNTGGEIKAGNALTLASDSLTGDGKLRSLGDISLTLLKDFIHTGDLIANGRLRLSSQGNVINSGLISAGTLDGGALNLTNQASGKILADQHQWRVKNTLFNTGLLDGNRTYLRAAELTNQGTGRIYGDHIAIDANTLNNWADADTKSAVIAARQRLDLGVGVLNNHSHSLIYSDGDFAFGGKLDAQYRASGKGKVINNHSAYLEAIGAMRLAADTLNNVNDHFETESQLISRIPQQEYGIWGERFDFNDPSIYRDDGEVMEVCYKGRGCKENFQLYQYTRTITETRVKATDPAKILAGKNLNIETATLTNDKSQVVAGGVLTVTGGDIKNIDVQGERSITDRGQVENFWRIKKKGRDRQGWGSEGYTPPEVIQAITLTPGTILDSQGTVRLEGQRPANYQGTSAHLTPVSGGQINARLPEAVTPSREVALRPGQRLEVIILPASVTGQRPAISEGTAEIPVIAGETLTEPGQTSTVGERLTRAGEHNTGLEEKTTNVGEKSLGVAGKTTNVGEKFLGVAEKTTNVGEKPLIVRTEVPNYTLPDNSLFKLNLPPDPAQPQPALDNLPLVETDPQFTQLKKWLGTDYMQQQLRWDHNNMHKRLGDGFYEQRLIREQVINLTGQRYLPGHQNDEEQFKALMNAGVRAQHVFNLVPGIALNAEQMARLTEDMVWLVNATVTLPGGRTQAVQVPQVYVRTQAGSLDGSGALLSGRQVNLQLTGEVLNQGRIVGQDINILAENIRNQGGWLQGKTVDLQARTDMVQRGGTIGADKSLTIGAGRHIDIASTTRSGENQAGNNRFSATYVDNVASVYVQGADGKLRLRAGKDINLSAAQLMSQGQDSDIQLDAGRDIQLGTAHTARGEHLEWSRDNTLTHTASGEIGTDINSAGQVSLHAGRDVSLRATGITAGKTLHVDAGRDVAVVAGEQQQTHDEYLKVKGSNSWVSSTTTTTRMQYDRTQAVSSTLSGDTVRIQSGKDTTVQGSNVVGTRDVTIKAGHNLNITTAEEKNHQLTQKEEKKSGLMGTGGVGFTIGSSALKRSDDSTATVQKGSIVGSSDASVTLRAGEQATVQGSEIIAGKDIDIEAKDVTITAAENRYTDLSKTEQKQSGLTLALSGAVGSAVDTAVKTAHDAKDTQGDSRLQALKGTQSVLSGVQGYQAWQLSQAESAKAEAINQAGGSAEKPTDTIGIQLSYGSQSAKSTTRTAQTQSQGSSLNAGRDIRITATGDSTTPDSGDIQVQGSTLKAGRDIALEAKRDIVLESAENSQTTRGENSSQGGSVGVGLTAGQGGYGIKFSASVNKGKGHETGDGVTHSETLIDAGNQVSLTSGQDTTLKGAQVSGDKVTADVGRNLHLQSEQDKDNYDSRQQNVSAGASFTYGSMSGSASVNASRDKIHSQFESVNEQTGIFAGKGGFDITVGGHTQLDGAVIASTADKDKNRLETGTLGFSDIQNKAEYKTEHQSVGVGTGGAIGSQLGTNMASNMLAGSNKSDSQSSTTQAAVSDGTIVVRDTDKQTQDVADLSRDTDNAANGLNPIFDKEKEQQRLAQAQAIADIGTQVMDIYNTNEAIKATKKATEDLKDPQTQQKLKQQAEAQLKQEKGDLTPEAIADRAYKIAYDGAIREQGADIGSHQRQAVTAVIGALQGLAGGDIRSAIASGAAPYLANAVKALTYGDKAYEQLTAEEKATNLMAHAILGGVIAEMKGGSATAGATGAVGGELAASAIINALYPGKTSGELSLAEKETVSNLSTLAGGIAAGLATNSTAGGVTGAQTAKNAVENNYLYEDESRRFDKELAECKAKGGDCGAVIQKYLDISNKNSAELEEKCKGGGITCVTYEDLIQANTNVALDEGSLQIRLSDKLKDPDAIKIVQYLNGKDLQFLKDNITTSNRVAAVALDPTSWPVMVFGAKAMIQGSKGKEQLIAAGITSGMNAAIQYGTTKEVKLSDLIGAGVVGAITAGKGYTPTVTWNAVGGYYTAEIKGDDPFLNAILSKGGASAGYAAGNIIKVPMQKVFNPISKQYKWEPIGIWTITKPVKQSSVPSVAGSVGDSAVSGWFNSTVGGTMQEGKQKNEKK